MAIKSYNYLGRIKIGISAPQELLKRIERNIEESGEEDLDVPDCLIKIQEANHLTKIKKDQAFPYERKLNGNGKEKYFRYGTLVRSTTNLTKKLYCVTTHILNDEGAGIIPMRDFCFQYFPIGPCFHAALIDIGGEGIMIVGKSKTGKTSMMLYFLERFGAKFIADEDVIVSYKNEELEGFYLPNTMRIRFKGITNTSLSYLLNDIKKADATQYIDEDTLEKIINARAFHVDAGLAISRKSLVECFNVDSGNSAKIDRIIFTEYSPSKTIQASKITSKNAKERLEKLLRRNQTLMPEWFAKIRLDVVKHSGLELLRKEGFE